MPPKCSFAQSKPNKLLVSNYNSSTCRATFQSRDANKTNMGKKKNKNKNNPIVGEFARYFGENTLENWQRLCRDIGIHKELPSITKCREVRFVSRFLFSSLTSFSSLSQPISPTPKLRLASPPSPLLAINHTRLRL